MGVPVFFKWLSMRNPKIIRDAHQAPHEQYDSGNPSVDNFYIDMNGLIHPSCNPKGQNIRQPSNFQEQCENIFEYIDKLINIVRPKKLVYLAIDGVAPRAKMNQQRSRRFRAAMEGVQMSQKKQTLLQEFKRMGAYNEELERYATKKSFDSNLITPGTQFLSAVCERLRGYIKQRLTNHKLWRNNTIIFSDANVPGEGEHKIMQFIRQERSSQGYSPNQSHCIYGADADLIMLSLATHQPRFFIIRQIVITANDKWCTQCGKRGHFFLDCMRANSIQGEQKVNQIINAGSINVNFQFLRIQMVREYLHLHFNRCTIPFGYNLQRIIDDFIFLCFFVGNDFLPHVPCLSIRDGGIDVLLRVYEYCLQVMPDYLTNTGEVNPDSLQIFIKQMGYHQQALIQQMKAKEHSAKMRQSFDKNMQNKAKNNEPYKAKNDEIVIDYKEPLASFKQELKKMSNQQISLQDYSIFGHPIYSSKEKYYREKFRIKPSQFMELKHNINKAYIDALRWICHYYYKGVPSWSWFYPFHYSPFFTDMKVIRYDKFQEGQPFRPFQQLMAVLSPKTHYALPKDLHHLMLDAKSPICDYFPKQFVVDLVGKKFAWLGQVLLPFIDDQRLIKAMGDYQVLLTQQENNRNRYGHNFLYISKYGNLGKKISNLVGLGGSMALTQESNDCIEGQVYLIQIQNEVHEYRFIQPQKRIHSIMLKQGITLNPLQQLDEDYVGRTDKKAFGGQRFVRVICNQYLSIERVLGRRTNTIRRQYNQQGGRNDRNQNNRNQNNYRGRRRNYNDSKESGERKSQERSRSRENRRNKLNQQQDNSRNKKDYKKQ